MYIWGLKNVINTYLAELPSCSEPWILPPWLSRSLHEPLLSDLCSNDLGPSPCLEVPGSPTLIRQNQNLEGGREGKLGNEQIQRKSILMLTKPLTYTQLQAPGASWNFIYIPFWFQRTFKVAFFTLDFSLSPTYLLLLTLLASQALITALSSV